MTPLDSKQNMPGRETQAVSAPPVRPGHRQASQAVSAQPPRGPSAHDPVPSVGDGPQSQHYHAARASGGPSSQAVPVPSVGDGPQSQHYHAARASDGPQTTKSCGLAEKKLFLFDMDGTIYLGERLFDGVKELLELIKRRGGRYLFLTNNSSKSVSAYVEKLRRLGLSAEEEDFFTSVDAACLLLKKKLGEGYAQKKLFALGTESFRRQLSEEGFWVTTEADDDTVLILVGYDTELTYKKLEDACRLLSSRDDIGYYATNPDWVCPTEWGFVPDCGSICRMIERAVGRKPCFIGKPKPDMVWAAIEKAGASPEETLLIGDRVYTDIACGINAGVDTCFVLSGEGTLSELKEYGFEPRYVLENVNELLKMMKA